MATLDLVLRIAASLQLAALAALLASSPRGGLAARTGALFCASVIAFVVTSAPIRLGALGYPLTALCVAKPALFWLFAKALFAEGFRIRRAHVIGSLAYEGLVLAFLLAALLEAWRGLATDLVERRRRVRVALVAGVAAYLAVVVAVQLSDLMLGVRTSEPLVMANLSLILATAFAVTASLLELRRRSWIDGTWAADAEGPPSGAVRAAEAALLADLQRRMTAESLYRREGLTIGALARI